MYINTQQLVPVKGTPDEALTGTLSTITASPFYRVGGALLAGLHGYLRHKQKKEWFMVGLWTAGGALSPLIALGVAMVQGYGKPSK